MSFLETTPLYLNFVMKNLLYNPINFMNDVSTDIKKDKKSQVYNSKINLFGSVVFLNLAPH